MKNYSRILALFIVCLMGIACLLSPGVTGVLAADPSEHKQNMTDGPVNTNVSNNHSSHAFEDLASAIGDGFETRIVQKITPGAPAVTSRSMTYATAADLQDQLDEIVEDLLELYEIDTRSTALMIQTLDGRVEYVLNPDAEFMGASLYKLPLALLWYEQINEKPSTASAGLLYRADMYEDVSVIASCYAPGSLIPIDELLRQVILTSDNTAGHILFEHLGGWEEFKALCAKRWPDHAKGKRFVSMDNVMTAGFMNDVVLEIALHPEDYPDLVEDMEQSQPEQYLNLSLQKPIAQKYGAYGSQLNASGFSLDAKYPYAITIMTDDVASTSFMAELSAKVQTLFDDKGQVEMVEAQPDDWQ